MGIVEALPYAGMVISQLAQVGLMVAGKVAMANGMTTFTFIFYSNLMASLILIPICFFLYRSTHPPLVPTFLYGFFLLGFLGFMVQLVGYTGLLFASASLSTTIFNLIPAFTFLLAIVLSMEKFNYKSFTTMAKCIGTMVSIIGAVVATLYQGPAILGTPIPPPLTLTASSSSFLIGGLLFTLDSVIVAVFMISQAVVIRKCPAELILMLFYSIFIAILSAASSLIVEKDLSAWSLNSAARLIPVIYSALFGNVFQVSISIWCVRRKGPVFASIFHPLGVVIAIAAGIIILGETFYLGSLVGAIVAVIGFYAVVWGKAKEAAMMEKEGIKSCTHSNGKRTPLLHNRRSSSLSDNSSRSTKNELLRVAVFTNAIIFLCARTSAPEKRYSGAPAYNHL